jgi:plasmid stabilization system protein ParE
MGFVLHPAVRKDLKGIIAYYKKVASPRVADNFYDEFLRAAEEAAKRPRSFSARERDTRRVNFTRLPYHLLFRVRADEIVVTVVRHNKRHPSFGMDRM